MNDNIQYEEVVPSNHHHLGHLFFEFWGDDNTSIEKEMRDAKNVSVNDNKFGLLVKDEEEYIGFVQFAIRHEYVDGMKSPFVGYIEGIYIRSAYQKMGIGKTLVDRGEAWAMSKGCTQVGSDTGIDNANSIGFHKHLGYKEQSRLVCFMKNLEPE